MILKKLFLTLNFCRNMSKIFKYKVNPITGTAEWSVESDDYDFYQEIARSGYADMLHDHERNLLYYQALKNVIGKLKKVQNVVNVVDIGTGTGLLAMMAVKAGADHVSAVEAFEPIAITAKKIIALNGFSDKIDVISKRSTDVDEFQNKAHVAVAEVFDTELIGEGALKTFYDAHKTLLTSSGRVIPAKGTIFVQVFQSDAALRWQKPFPIVLPRFKIQIQVPNECSSCPGAPSVHDVQMNQFPRNLFVPLTKPVPVFAFNFENADEIRFEENETFELTTEFSNLDVARADGVIMWWDLDMDGSGDLILSTKPRWSEDNDVQWRDHWMQAFYYFPRPIWLKNGQNFNLNASHDEYSLWFSASEGAGDSGRPACACGLHLMFSRTNLARFNDLDRYANFSEAISSFIVDKTCLSIGDCSVLPLIALQMGARRVYSLETNRNAQEIIENYAKFNDIDVGDRLIFVSSVDRLYSDVTLDFVFSDIFFFNSVLPWHNLHFWYVTEELRKNNLLSKDCIIFPDKASVRCLPVQFDDLHKIRTPIKSVEGFDLTPFDDIVQAAIKTCDADVEPQPLWEYPSTTLSETQVLLDLDLSRPVSDSSATTSLKIPLSKNYDCNGVALWVDWYFCDKLINGGLKKVPAAGDRPDWDWNQRQGVHFLRNISKRANFLNIQTTFFPLRGDISFNFCLE